MSTEIPISLRSWPSNAHDPSALPTLIQRINTERGGFLNLTEESLRQEITEQEINGQNEEEESSSEDEEEPDKMKELLTARDELLREIEYVFTFCEHVMHVLRDSQTSPPILPLCAGLYIPPPHEGCPDPSRQFCLASPRSTDSIKDIRRRQVGSSEAHRSTKGG
jgi:hypothetical protein